MEIQKRGAYHARGRFTSVYIESVRLRELKLPSDIHIVMTSFVIYSHRYNFLPLCVSPGVTPLPSTVNDDSEMGT